VATAKIHCRKPTFNFQTGYNEKIRVRIDRHSVLDFANRAIRVTI
jgi:hypothetical protein